MTKKYPYGEGMRQQDENRYREKELLEGELQIIDRENYNLRCVYGLRYYYARTTCVP